jgi:tRNA G18 (ribose-2'-O)-methylase SpoU
MKPPVDSLNAAVAAALLLYSAQMAKPDAENAESSRVD